MATLATDSCTLAVAVDVKQVDVFYALTAATASAPDKPTTATPASPWQAAEPAYDSSKQLWTCQRTTLTDGTFYWSAVSKSSSYSGANAAYNKADAAGKAAASAQEELDASRSWYATCATAAATAAKVATITPATTAFALRAGAKVYVKFSATNSAAVGSLTLDVDGTGAKPIKTHYNGGVNNLYGAGYLRADSAYEFTYDGTNWICEQGAVNSTYNMAQVGWSQAVLASSDGYAGTHVIMGDAGGYRNLAAGKSFDLGYPLLYYATSGYTAAAGTTTNNSFLEYPGISFTANGTVEQGAANKALWLKGTVVGGTFTVAASPFMTTKVPDGADGYVYIPLGVMSSATAGHFSSSSALWAYKDGAFQELSRGEASLASKTATSYIMDYGSGSTKGVWFTPEDRRANADGEPNADTRGWRIGDALELFRGVASVFKVWAEDAVARVRIGEDGKSRFEVGADSIEAYGQDGSKYFEVSADGLRWGDFGEDGEQFAAASQDGVEELAGSLDGLSASVDARFGEQEAAIAEAGAANQLVYLGDEGIVIGRRDPETGAESMAVHVITNDRDSFRYGGEEVAAIGVDSEGAGALIIDNAEVSTRMGFGGFSWETGADGGLKLKWRGTAGEE